MENRFTLCEWVNFAWGDTRKEAQENLIVLLAGIIRSKQNLDKNQEIGYNGNA